MSALNPPPPLSESDVAQCLSEADLDRAAAAIEKARCPHRQGPYGGFDYGYRREDNLPAGGRYVIRDMRDPHSPSWDRIVHRTQDEKEHERMFDLLTGRHLATAAALAFGLNLSPHLLEQDRQS